MSSTIRRSAAIAAGAALLLVAGCGSDSDTATDATTTTVAATTTEAAPAELMIEDVWARTSPAAVTLGAAYAVITSPIDDKLIGASAPATIAKTTEIHETVLVDSSTSDSMGSETTEMMGSETTEMMGSETTEAMGSETTEMMGSETTEGMGGDMGGEMEMRPIESLDLPAGEAVKLEPGGYHIMLIDLVAPLKAGDTFELTLTFENAGEKTVTVTVRDA